MSSNPEELFHHYLFYASSPSPQRLLAIEFLELNTSEYHVVRNCLPFKFQVHLVCKWYKMCKLTKGLSFSVFYYSYIVVKMSNCQLHNVCRKCKTASVQSGMHKVSDTSFVDVFSVIAIKPFGCVSVLYEYLPDFPIQHCLFLSFRSFL